MRGPIAPDKSLKMLSISARPSLGWARGAGVCDVIHRLPMNIPASLERMDIGEMRRRLGHDEELIADLFGLFLEDYPAQIGGHRSRGQVAPRRRPPQGRARAQGQRGQLVAPPA